MNKPLITIPKLKIFDIMRVTSDDEDRRFLVVVEFDNGEFHKFNAGDDDLNFMRKVLFEMKCLYTPPEGA